MINENTKDKLWNILILSLLIAVGASSGQDTNALISQFQNQGIPVSSIRAEDGTITAEIGVTESDSIDPADLEQNNIAVFSKIAENYPDSSIIRIEYKSEGEVFNILEIDTQDITAGLTQGWDRTEMLAYARMGVTQALRDRINSELENLQSQDEASDATPEFTLPERTVDIPDESAISSTPSRSSRGGGGGGGMRAPSGLSGTTIILLVVLLSACLALGIAIFSVLSRARRSPSRIRADLEVIYSDGGTKVFSVVKEVTRIGRDPSNDLVLNDPQVSSIHAEIVISDRTFFIRDLQSANGTQVNGNPIEESPIYSGDEIKMGQTRLLVSG